MPPFNPYLSVIHLLGVILATVLLAHFCPSPYWIIGGAAMVCLFLV